MSFSPTRISIVESAGQKHKSKPSSSGKAEIHHEVLDKGGTTIWNKECDSITERSGQYTLHSFIFDSYFIITVKEQVVVQWIICGTYVRRAWV